MSESTDTGTTPRDKRNVKRYIQLSFLWAVIYVACTFVLQGDYIEAIPLRLLLAFIPSVFAVLSTRAYWRYLNGMDELLRMIELKALALSLSAGFVLWPAIELLEVGVPMDIHTPVILLVMTGVYVFALAKGRMNYLL